MIRQKKNIFGERKSFKPFQYQWAYDLYLKHERMHWISREVALHDDIKDWNTKLTEDDRNFLSNVFLLFTQGDIDVASGYVKDYLPHFNHAEIRMMLLGFAAREATHIDAYSYLIETLGKPDSFYDEFLHIDIMRQKHEYFEKIVDIGNNKENLPLQIAGISSFTEGMFLFSSFVMLLTYPRNGKMKGMGQIVTWSILDEQCLTDDAEVMTTYGWKLLKDVALQDKVLQYDMDTKKTEFVYPTKLIKNYTNEIIEFKGQDFCQKVTPEHRMVIEKDGSIQTVLAKDVKDIVGEFRYILSGEKNGELKTMTDKQIELCILSAKGEIDLQWIIPLIPEIDSTWAKEFLVIFQQNM